MGADSRPCYACHCLFYTRYGVMGNEGTGLRPRIPGLTAVTNHDVVWTPCEKSPKGAICILLQDHALGTGQVLIVAVKVTGFRVHDAG
jgi:hypothetical protein